MSTQTTSKSDERLLYSRAETCRLLGICLSSLDKLVDQGRLRPLYVGDSPRFSRSELERFATAQ